MKEGGIGKRLTGPQGFYGDRGNTESGGPKTGEFGGAKVGGNHPYQSPPPPPALPEPDSSRCQDGGCEVDGGSGYFRHDQANEVASECIDAKDRRTDDAHACHVGLWEPTSDWMSRR